MVNLRTMYSSAGSYSAARAPGTKFHVHKIMLVTRIMRICLSDVYIIKLAQLPLTYPELDALVALMESIRSMFAMSLRSWSFFASGFS